MLINNGTTSSFEKYIIKFFSDNYYIEIINIFFTSIASLVFLIYFLSLASCIMKNPWNKTKSLIIFWIDFFLVLVITLIICSIYLFILIFLADAGLDNTKAPFSAQLFIVYSLLSFAIIFNSIMTIDIINNFKLSKSMYTLINVKGYSLHEIGTSLKGLCLYPITNKKSHCINLIVMCSLQILFIIILRILNSKDLLQFGLLLMKCIICILFILVLISKSICNYYKSLLLGLTYHNSNLVILKLFNSQANYALYLSDIISYKILIDLLGAIPLILFSLIGRLHTYAMIISYMCLFGYIVLSGSLYITIDKSNRSIILTDLTRTIFFYRKIPFILENDIRLYDEFDFELNEEEAYLFGQVDHSFFRDNIHLQLIENAHFGSAGLFETSTERFSDVMKIPFGSKSGFRKLKDIPLLERIEINTPENYYIVCKMLYLYFEKNQGVYMEHEKKMEEEAAPIQKLIFNNATDSDLGSSNNNNRTYRTNMNKTKEYIDGLDRFNKLSKLVEKRFTVTYKTGFNNLFSSLEEKEYRESFRKRYALYEPSKSEFKIESLFNNDLLELFPFYQIHVKDLLNSLEPGNNKEIFVNLSNQKESVSLLSSTSGFYTFDSFLFFEIYNANDFSIEKLRTFVNKYKEYLIEVVKNMDFTFLPIIVGMYIITILGNDKLIILYRHPLSSTQYSQFTQWINFIVTEEPESIKVSTEVNSIIDINEVEIKNNIRLPPDQYQELKSVLQNDIHFIVHTLNMETYPIANLFVGTEPGNSQCYMLDSSIGEDDINYQNVSGIGGGGAKSGKSFNVLLRDHTLDASSIGGNMMAKKIKKEGGSELISLFEKDYMIYNSNNHYTLKIYFTNFFRKTCVVNEKENEKHKLSHEVYCVYVQDRLLNYFHENKDLFKGSSETDMGEPLPKRDNGKKHVFFLEDNEIN